MSPFSLLRAVVFTFLLLNAACANPLITEFMADNVSFLADEDGAYSDWIEIHNPGAAPLVLTDWALTDDAANLTKWKFPAVTVQPGEFLVVSLLRKTSARQGCRCIRISRFQKRRLPRVRAAGRDNDRAAIRARVSGNGSE